MNMKSKRLRRMLFHVLGGIAFALAVNASLADTVYALDRSTAAPSSSVAQETTPEAETEHGPAELLWSYATGGPVHSSPTVAEGVLYVGSMDGYLYALDAATGELRWRYETGHGFISSPLIDERVVYIGSHEGYVYALKAASGELLWRYATDSPVYSSPTVVEGVLYVGSMDGHMYALNAATGELRWRYATDGALLSSPTVVEGVLYVGSEDGLLALDAASGTQIWIHEIDWGRVSSSPTVAEDVVYFGSEYGHLYALNAATGKIRWRYAVSAPDDDGYSSSDLSANVHSSPLLVDGIVYVGSGHDEVYALDAASGEVYWRYATDHAVNSSPAASDGVIYVGSDDGHLYALDAAGGTLLRRYKTDGPVLSSPTVADGVVYVGSGDGHIYALPAATPAPPQPVGEQPTEQESSETSVPAERRSEKVSPQLLWSFENEEYGFRTASPVFSDGVVYIGYDDYVYAVDAATGEPFWRFETGGWVVSTPAVADGAGVLWHVL